MRREGLSHGGSGRAARLLVLAAALIPVAGCVTLPVVPTTHIVMVNGRGNPVDPTGNIGCLAQIAGGTAIPILHTVELLDWAHGGPIPEKLVGDSGER